MTGVGPTSKLLERTVYPKAHVLNRFIAKLIDLFIVVAADEIAPPVGFLSGLAYILIADGFAGGKDGPVMNLLIYLPAAAKNPVPVFLGLNFTGNLTVTGQTTAGFLYIGPVAMVKPGSSTLNFPISDSRANGVNVWYRFTLTGSEVVSADTAGTGWDTALFVKTDAHGDIVGYAGGKSVFVATDEDTFKAMSDRVEAEEPAASPALSVAVALAVAVVVWLGVGPEPVAALARSARILGL